jgi:hypothetical protein
VVLHSGGVRKRCRGECVRALAMEMCLYHWSVELDLPADATLEAVVAELGRREAEGAA